jgi:hypothetical protein
MTQGETRSEGTAEQKNVVDLKTSAGTSTTQLKEGFSSMSDTGISGEMKSTTTSGNTSFIFSALPSSSDTSLFPSVITQMTSESRMSSPNRTVKLRDELLDESPSSDVAHTIQSGGSVNQSNARDLKRHQVNSNPKPPSKTNDALSGYSQNLNLETLTGTSGETILTQPPPVVTELIRGAICQASNPRHGVLNPSSLRLRLK